MCFAGKKDSEVYTHLIKLINNSFPNQDWISEGSYTSKEMGFGGASRFTFQNYCNGF